MNRKGIVFVIVGALAICAVVFGGLALTKNIGKTDKVVSEEQGAASIAQMVSRIAPTEAALVKSAVDYTDEDDAAAELPDIDTLDVVVKETTGDHVEIFAPSNIAGATTDGWMVDMAEQFNASKPTVDGKEVSVRVRKVASGYMLDYTASGKYVPDAICPSNELWISMLKSGGVETETVSDSMVKDVAGVLFSKEKYDELIAKYGTIDMKSVTEAVSAGEVSFGYTNPFTSATGMNFLISTLLRYDSNPLSTQAADGFKSFQTNIPLVSLTTQQMVKAASNGSLDGFVNEYQVYSKDPTLQAEYTFTPFGFRHDYPLVAVGDSASDKHKLAVLEAFSDFCDANGVELASKDGFGGMDDYVCESALPDGATLSGAQKFYKKNKDAGNPVVAVFVADVSGSMSGAPIQALQSSLINSMKYINADNYIGLVSYSDDVTINLPIGKFDIEQQTYFKGAVESLKAAGNTATFDGIVVAADMINKKMTEIPDAKPMIFVLSDGDCNRGYTLNDISDALQGLCYPVYTVGYNANISALSQISDINEAATIDADTDDVAYQLKTLFNANM